MQYYDVFVIGSGMAGMNVANRSAAKGLKVGITDERPYGGTCALRGCDPKKILLAPTEAEHLAGNLQDKAMASVASVDWKAARGYKQEFVEAMPPKIEKGYEKAGVDAFHDSARFVAENQLQVGDETIEADKIVVATGAKALQLDFPGGDLALTSTDFLDFKELPESLVFVGGGYIAFEFAQMAARYGSKVTILHRGQRPLENFDPFIVEQATQATEALDIEVVLETDVTAIEETESGYRVTGQNGTSKHQWEAEQVINASGRPPAIFDLDLDKAGVAFGPKGIEVNEYLQSTSNPAVYAVGDAAHTDGLPLTPVAVMEGHILASNITKGNNKTADYTAIPSVVFTVPPMASVGYTEERAKAEGLDFTVKQNSVPNWFTAKRINESTYAFKTLIENYSGKILGAHLIGPHAEEVINLFAMAMKTGLNARAVKTMVLTYPSASSDIVHMV